MSKVMNHDNTEPSSDHEILLLSIENPAIFARIVDSYQDAFLRKARSITRNDEDAQDIVQETFVKIYQNAAKFEKREAVAFSSWAYRILLNTCYTHYQKHKKSRGNVSFDDSILSAQPEEESTNTERFLLILSKIPDKFARLLRLLVLEGKSQEDVAALEGVKEGTLRVRLHRAKSAFKKVLIENPHL